MPPPDDHRRLRLARALGLTLEEFDRQLRETGHAMRRPDFVPGREHLLFTEPTLQPPRAGDPLN